MTEQVIASFPLTVASYKKCSRLLARGEVKRSMQRGPLVGYVIGCPACGFSGSYVDEDCGTQRGVGFVEDPPKNVPMHDARKLRELVGMARPPTCIRCRRVIRVREGRLEAVEPSP